MVLAKNSFVLAKGPKKSLFWPKWLDFDKSCSKLSFFANLTFLSQKLLKTVFFDRNSFSLAKIHRATESKRQNGPKWSRWQTGSKKSKWQICPNAWNRWIGINKFNWEIRPIESKYQTGRKNTQFWAAFTKMKQFGTKQTVLSSLFQTKPFCG